MCRVLAQNCVLHHWSSPQAKALYQKLQREADSLKGLWVAKLNLRGRAELASPEELRAYEVIRDKVISQNMGLVSLNCFH